MTTDTGLTTITRIPWQAWRLLKVIAETEQRPLSTQLGIVVREWAEERGISVAALPASDKEAS